MLTARSSLLARRSSLPALPRSTTSTPSVRLLGRLAGGNLYPTRSAIIRASSSSSSYNSNTAGTSNTRRHSSWNITAAAAVVVLSAGLLSTLLAQPLLAEEAKQSSSQAPFTKEDIGVICIIGGPSSGKTTQLENAAKRFNLTTLDAKKQDLKKEIEKLVNDGGKSSGGNNEKKEKIRVIIEGFPKTIEQANKFQDEVVPILLIISIVLDAPKGIDRVKGDDESLRRDAKINWKRFEDNSEELIKQFRFQGNILEITGEWPEDEVWEQVEAKLESALELDDRGEL